jgi:hypothetical protein
MPVLLPEDVRAAVEPSPAVVVEPLPLDPEPDLNSSTLAELYFNQGFTDQAIDVYRQISEREPGNERVQARLRELEALKRHLHEQETPPPPAASPGGGDEAGTRAARRAALTRTIARLQGLQAALRKG